MSFECRRLCLRRRVARSSSGSIRSRRHSIRARTMGRRAARPASTRRSSMRSTRAWSRLGVVALLLALAPLNLDMNRDGPWPSNVFRMPSTVFAQTGGTLVIGLDQEPPTLDPHASPSAVCYQIIASVTENLLFRGPDGKLVPWLAESWTTTKDGRSTTFKLRRDVKFHDGTPFNAESVKFNFDRIVDPKF